MEEQNKFGINNRRWGLPAGEFFSRAGRKRRKKRVTLREKKKTWSWRVLLCLLSIRLCCIMGELNSSDVWTVNGIQLTLDMNKYRRRVNGITRVDDINQMNLTVWWAFHHPHVSGEWGMQPIGFLVDLNPKRLCLTMINPLTFTSRREMGEGHDGHTLMRSYMLECRWQ